MLVNRFWLNPDVKPVERVANVQNQTWSEHKLLVLAITVMRCWMVKESEIDFHFKDFYSMPFHDRTLLLSLSLSGIQLLNTISYLSDLQKDSCTYILVSSGAGGDDGGCYRESEREVLRERKVYNSAGLGKKC